MEGEDAFILDSFEAPKKGGGLTGEEHPLRGKEEEEWDDEQWEVRLGREQWLNVNKLNLKEKNCKKIYLFILYHSITSII